MLHSAQRGILVYQSSDAAEDDRRIVRSVKSQAAPEGQNHPQSAKCKGFDAAGMFFGLFIIIDTC